MVDRQRIEKFDLGDGQPGVAEQRQPRRQIRCRILQSRKGFPMPDVWRVDTDAVDEGLPQRRLPVQVGVEVGTPVAPLGEDGRALPRVGREERREPSRHGVAPPLPQFPLAIGGEVAQVGGQGAAPRLVEALVDHLQQRPDHGVRRPWIVVVGTGDLGDQRVRVPELDAGAHPIRPGPATQDVGQALAEPSLGSAGGNQDQLLGEWVLERSGEQGTEPVCQQIGAIGAVEVKRHRRHPRTYVRQWLAFNGRASWSRYRSRLVRHRTHLEGRTPRRWGTI